MSKEKTFLDKLFMVIFWMVIGYLTILFTIKLWYPYEAGKQKMYRDYYNKTNYNER